MSAEKINWQFFPKNIQAPDLLLQVVNAFEAQSSDLHSLGNVGQTSDEVLAKVRPALELLGFNVEKGKSAAEKIRVPVLYGPNGKIEKYFEADGFHPDGKTVIEIEAGRAVVNYQFLKDLFEACLMQDVEYLVIAVRNDYRGLDDFGKVISFFESLYASQRLNLPLSGILILGY